MNKVGYILNNIEDIIACAAFVAMTVVTVVNVILRYLTNYMFPWSEELGRFTFMWTTFFGAAMCTKYGRHLVIDILINSARRRFKIIMEFIVNIVTITLMAVLIFYGWKLTIASNVPTASLGIPLSYVVFGVPFSCTLILIRTLVGMVKQLRAATSLRR